MNYSEIDKEHNNTEVLFTVPNKLTDSRLKQLKQLFPDCFDKNGVFLSERFTQVLNNSDVDTNKEYYTMNWLGKSYAKMLRDLPPKTLLTENIEHNRRPENQNSQNLLLKGDNLEVLKHLNNAYKNKVKMIYIDPPYNTGSDGFVYQDDRKLSVEKLVAWGGVNADEAQRILNFTSKKSNSHSAWLTFMYPRLYLARELLSEDGVIFISIDDNEQAQLKLLCDEVFGEESCIAKCIHKNNSNKNQSKFIGVSTEYIFIYAKNLDYLSEKVEAWRINKEGAKDIARKFKELQKMGLSLSEIEAEIKQMYKRPKYSHLGRWNKVDENGVFMDDNLSREGGRKDYTIINPNTGKPCVIPPRGWGKSYEELLRLQEQNLIWYGDDNTAPRIKSYIEVELLSVPDNFWYFDNSTDTRFIKNIFGTLAFDNPKPVDMLKRMLQLSTNQNDLILDFFAGSGTTAHAVMQLNAEDGSKRQFIMVQLPESTSPKSEAHKAGYHTIFDITKARIEKAAAKIKTDKPDYQGDLGFKIFETVDDFRTFPEEDSDSPQKAFSFPNLSQLSTEEIHTLLTTWRVFDGQRLPEKIQTVYLAGYQAYLCDKHLYLLHSGFGTPQTKALLDKLDDDKNFVLERIILLGDTVESAKQQELDQAVKTYTNKKSLKINVLVRY